ncbi:hypothetical protein D3C74_395530 [compost metagenome]
MICNQHQLSRLKACVDGSAGIGDKQLLDTQRFHNANRECHFVQCKPFIVMKATFHRYNRLAHQLANNQFIGMTDCLGLRKVRNFCVGNNLRIFNLVSERSQPRTQNHAYGRFGMDSV